MKPYTTEHRAAHVHTRTFVFRVRMCVFMCIVQRNVLQDRCASPESAQPCVFLSREGRNRPRQRAASTGPKPLYTQDLMRSMDPHPSWGPSDPEVNERYKRFMAEHGAPLHSGASLPVRSQTEGRTLPIEAAPEVEEEPAMATGATHDTTVISPSTRDTGTLDQSGSSQPPEMPRPTTPEYGMTEDVYVVKGGLDDAKQAEKAAEV